MRHLRRNPKKERKKVDDDKPGARLSPLAVLVRYATTDPPGVLVIRLRCSYVFSRRVGMPCNVRARELVHLPADNLYRLDCDLRGDDGIRRRYGVDDVPSDALGLKAVDHSDVVVHASQVASSRDKLDHQVVVLVKRQLVQLALEAQEPRARNTKHLDRVGSRVRLQLEPRNQPPGYGESPAQFFSLHSKPGRHPRGSGPRLRSSA